MASSELTTHRTRTLPQPPKSIGFLGATTPTIWSRFVAAFEERLRYHNWINGHNLRIDYGWAGGLPKNYKSIAERFVSDRVDIIVTSSTGAAIAARDATQNLDKPYVYYAAAGDPKNTGLQPSGNITGESNEQTDLAPQRIGVLREVFPRLKKLAIIGNLASLNVQYEKAAVLEAAKAHKINTSFHSISHPERIARTITKLEGKADALFVCTDPLLTTYQLAVNTAAVSAGLPTMHAFREHVEAGGLMSYGPNFSRFFTLAADNVSKLLDKAKPSDIPVELVKTFELVINLSTAYELGVKIPKKVLDRADKVW
jgi:putative tryptophan/tyrosine transport system substrate-binding protein